MDHARNKCILWIFCGAWLAASAAVAQQPETRSDIEKRADGGGQFQQTVVPLLTRYCYECHNSQKRVADLALDKYKTPESVIEGRGLWELVSQYVHTQQMPPGDRPQPTEAERSQISRWVNGQLLAHYTAHPDPGRVTIRRLNKNEYNNTIRDLVGVTFQPADDFPDDDSGYGFDNIGDVLSLPPVLIEKYLAAADAILNAALPTEPPVSKVRHIAAAQAEVGFNALGDRGDGWVHLISLEEDDVAVELPVAAGDYIFRVKAFCKPTGGSLVGQGSSVVVIPQGTPDPTKLGIFLGSTFCQDLEIDATEENPKVYETRIGVAAGKQRFSASVRRNRGGSHELKMLNGRIGTQQPGIIFVKWIEIEGPLPAAIARAPAKKLECTGEGRLNAEGSRVLDKNGQVDWKFNVPKAGEYILRAEACHQQAGSEPVKMEFRVNGQAVQSFDVVAPATLLPLPTQRLFDINLLNARPYLYEIRQKLPAGEVCFSAAFTNDFEDPAASNPNLRNRNLIVNYLEAVDLQEPLPPPPMPDVFARHFQQSPTPNSTENDARQMLENFAQRAYRRPVRAKELDGLMSLFGMARKDGESFADSLKVALKAVLVSPHFLFRGETQPDPNNSKSIHPIDELALASRLSYFLWSSMPDDELLELARRHELRKNLTAQVRRMIASPKSSAFVQNFSGQWLQLRTLATLAPDRDKFREYDDGLRKAMQRETELLFDRILHENRSVMEFLNADYTFVNHRLARFYGLTPVAGDEFKMVPLTGTRRRGVLTHGSILTLTSNPTRTSPVKRGKFVLENLLGTPPPPPPADVPLLEEQAKVSKGTLRQQMEAHRENAVCASCHAQMDPIGFGLENYDAIGKWRETEGTAKVDAAGRLKSGEEFQDAAQLVDILVEKRPDEFLHCLSERLLTYALGRGVEPFDRPALATIVENAKRDGCRFESIILQIVGSMPFQMQRGETSE